MKPFTMWIIVDKRGHPWRYSDNSPVIWSKREDAKYDAEGLDPKRGWRPLKVTVTAKSKVSE
jgi:hypothetical protein